MPNGNQPERGSPSQNRPETQWAGGDARDSSRTHRIHQDEMALGNPDADSADTPPAGAAAATSADLEEFRRALVELGLVTDEELAHFNAATPSGEGVLGLARSLVTAGKITAYQSAALYQHKGRGLLIGHYLILDKLGAGGMGMVFQARHRRLGTVVALKILPPSFARDRQAVLRFQREVEAASRLNHPNIVAALDAAEDRGVHFLVMEYVEGRDLDRVVRERGPMRVAEAVDCLIQAARGLAAAHAQGIVHRDIKPSNLMLDGAGTVRVLDLGLALIVDSSNPFGQTAATRLTASGMYMGTVDYMAPEQAEDSKRADHRADIYSLGCTLFYLLTGREPFVAETVLKRLMAHLERPAPSLRAARPDVPTALEEAYQKMMAKRPADRPASMSAVIALLEVSKTAAVEPPPTAALGAPPRSSPQLKVFDEAPLKRAGQAQAGRGESVFARRDKPTDDAQVGSGLSLDDLVMDVRSEIPLAPPLPTIKRAVKPRTPPPDRPVPGRSRPARGDRRRGLVLALGVLALLGIAFVGFLEYAAGPRDTHPRASSRAPEETPPPGSDVETPPEAVPPQPPPAVPKLAMVARTIFDGRSNRGWMLCNQKPLPRKNVQPDGLNPHGTGSYLVVYEKKLSDFVLDFDYKLSRGCNSGVFLRVGNLDDPVHTGIEVALDDTTGAGYEDSGAFFSLVAPRVNAQKPAGEWNHMTITAAGAVLSVSLNGTEVSRIQLDQWSVPGRRPDGTAHKFQGIAVADLPRSGYLGFQNLRGDCWFQNIVLKTPSGPATSTPGDAVAGAGASPPAQPHASEPEPWVEVGWITGHDNSFVEQVQLLSDQKTLLTTSMDGSARLWDLASGREIRRLWHPEGVRAVALLPDGRRAVTGCLDGYVRLWDLQTGTEVRKLIKHRGRVWGVAVSRDGRLALSGGQDPMLWVSDIDRGGEDRRFQGQDSMAWCVAVSPDGRRVLSGGEDGIVRLGDWTRTESVQRLTGHSRMVYGVAFNPDSRHAVSGAFGQLISWDLVAKQRVRSAALEPREVAWPVLAPDGRRVYFGTHVKPSQGGVEDRGSFGFWDLGRDDSPQVLNRGHGHLGLALLPEGRIATADLDGVVRIWQPSRAIARARERAGEAKGPAALSEYAQAIEARPGDARLWIERGRLLFELGRVSEADDDYAHAARLAPDNPQLFLDTAGWWVAGPYPFDVQTSAPLESIAAPDSTKLPPAGAGEPRRWQRVAIGMQGIVDLGPIFHRDDVAAYALAVVASGSKREVVLLIGTDDSAQFWINGQPGLQANSYADPYGWFSLVTLRPGRNTILAKVVNQKGPHNLHLRISDAPADLARAHVNENVRRWDDAAKDYQRALARDPSSRDADLHTHGGTALAKLGRWKEAALAFERAVELDPGNLGRWSALARADLAATSPRNRTSFRRVCKEVLDRFGDSTELVTANNAIWIAALAPEALSPPDYDRAVRIGKGLMDDKRSGSSNINTFGALLYRDGQYTGAVSYLKKSVAAQKGRGSAGDWVFLAMAYHRLKQPDEAHRALLRANQLAKEVSPDWQSQVEIRALLEEAQFEFSLPPP